MAEPLWFMQLRTKWSPAISVADLRSDITRVEEWPGVYVITNGSAEMTRLNTLYVGESLNLRTRLKNYVKNWKVRDEEKDKEEVARRDHKGKLFIWHERNIAGDEKIFVRWCYCVSIKHVVKLLEASLMDHLRPVCNSRMEDIHYETLLHREQIPKNYLV